MTIDIIVPIRTVSETNRREHWAKRASRVKQHRLATWASLRAADTGRKLLGHIVVTLTRIAPRRLDDDNLRSALKACRDGVADWLGVDDRSPLVKWLYAQQRGWPRHYAVRIQIATTTSAGP